LRRFFDSRVGAVLKRNRTDDDVSLDDQPQSEIGGELFRRPSRSPD